MFWCIPASIQVIVYRCKIGFANIDEVCFSPMGVEPSSIEAIYADHDRFQILDRHIDRIALNPWQRFHGQKYGESLCNSIDHDNKQDCMDGEARGTDVGHGQHTSACLNK